VLLLQLGISSIVCFKEGVLKAVEVAKNLKVDHLDIFCSPKHFTFDTPNEYLKELREILNSSKLSVSIKAPAFTQNIASFNDYVRDLTLAQYKRCIDICAKLDCQLVTIRAGIFFYEEKRKRVFAQKRLLESLEELLEYASRLNVTLLIENYYLPMDAVKKVKDLRKIIELCSHHDNIGVALNIAHLLNVRESIQHLIYDRILKKYIRIIYVGLPPTPWDLDYDESKLSNVIENTKKIIPLVHDPIVIIASISMPIIKKMLEILR